jgi:hypothetical protein
MLGTRGQSQISPVENLAVSLAPKAWSSPVSPSPFSTAAPLLADKIAVGRERELDNTELRALFGVARVTARQRER